MSITNFSIRKTPFLAPELQELLKIHRETMQNYSPEESIHAIDIREVEPIDTHYYCVWDDKNIAGCIALKVHNEQLAEIKSMKTADNYLRKGVARMLLCHIIERAKEQNVTSLNLETGTHSAFLPAIELYRSFNFESCLPFEDYVEDPNSTFMRLLLR